VACCSQTCKHGPSLSEYDSVVFHLDNPIDFVVDRSRGFRDYLGAARSIFLSRPKARKNQGDRVAIPLGFYQFRVSVTLSGGAVFGRMMTELWLFTSS
jgi:hypothetical protein